MVVSMIAIEVPSVGFVGDALSIKAGWTYKVRGTVGDGLALWSSLSKLSGLAVRVIRPSQYGEHCWFFRLYRGHTN